MANQRILFPHEKAVKEGSVKLSEVANIKGFSKKSKEYISKIELVSKINRGEVRKISEQAITDILRTHLPKIKKLEKNNRKDLNLVLKAPKLLSLYVTNVSFNETNLKQEILKQNKQFCRDCKFEFTDFNLPRIELSKVKTWKLSKLDKVVKGSFQVPVTVELFNQSKEQIFYLSGKMSAFKVMPVARRNLRPGDRIQKEDILWEKRIWDFIRKDLGSEAELLNAKMRRSVLSGGVIWLSNLEREKHVQRGDLVDVIVKKNGWEMRLKAVAQKEGVIGDTVSVLNRNSKKVLSAVVVGKQEVQLQ